MAGFMSGSLSGSQLPNLGKSSPQTSGLVGNALAATNISSLVGNTSDATIGTSLSSLGTKMAKMDMPPELKSSLTKWNTEFSKMSQKMQSLGINASQTSSITGVFGMNAAPNIGGNAATHIKNPHFNSQMTSVVSKMRKMGKK